MTLKSEGKMKYLYEALAGFALAAIVAWAMVASVTDIPFVYQGF